MTLVFTKVLDDFLLGLVDEDEDAEAEPTDRAYWEKRATKATVGLADQMLEILRGFDSTLNLKFNKFYIGLEKDGQAFNFVRFRPQKTRLNLEMKLPQTDDIDTKIDDAEIDTLEYDKKWGNYRLRLTREDIESKSDILKGLSQLAYARRSSP